jgi:hypothetical protein
MSWYSDQESEELLTGLQLSLVLCVCLRNATPHIKISRGNAFVAQLWLVILWLLMQIEK